MPHDSASRSESESVSESNGERALVAPTVLQGGDTLVAIRRGAADMCANIEGKFIAPTLSMASGESMPIPIPTPTPKNLERRTITERGAEQLQRGRMFGTCPRNQLTFLQVAPSLRGGVFSKSLHTPAVAPACSDWLQGPSLPALTTRRERSCFRRP
jgi:hypothetical protein